MGLLAEHFDEFAAGASKFSTECQNMIQKPFKLFAKSYRFATLRILYKIRKLQCDLGVEVRKAKQVRNYQLFFHEAVISNWIISCS